MKINGKTQLGLAFDKYMQRDLLGIHHKKYVEHITDPFTAYKAMHDLQEMFSNENNKNYLFRETAIKLAQSIKLDKGKLEDFSFLNSLPVKKATYLMGKDKFFRWHRWDEKSDIICLIVKLEDVDPEHIQDVKDMQELFKLPDYKIREIITERRQNGKITPLEADILLNSIKNQDFRNLASKGIKYYVFGIDPHSGRLLFPNDDKNEDFEKEMMNFVKLLLFTELSEIETVILNPGQSNGTKKEGKHLNESSVPVTIVDSTWNKNIIRTEGFTVRGHLRLQPHGPCRQYRKLIFIDEFEKQGYSRTTSDNVC